MTWKKYLVPATGQSCISFCQNTLHPQKERAFDLVFLDKGGENGGGKYKYILDITWRNVLYPALCFDNWAPTLNKVRMVGLMCCQHRSHFVMVRRVYVFVNAITRQLYLLKWIFVIPAMDADSPVCAVIAHRGAGDVNVQFCCRLDYVIGYCCWNVKRGEIRHRVDPAYCTCDRPRWTDAVSEMYIIFPSGATTKMNPSNVWGNEKGGKTLQVNGLWWITKTQRKYVGVLRTVLNA